MNQAIEAYRHVSASEQFKEIERMRDRARHNEASALGHAKRQGAEREREKWQDIVAEKDAENERLRKQIAALQAQFSENK